MDSVTKSTRSKLKDISSISTFNHLLDKLVLSAEERDILILIYVEKKQLSYIADYYGYSEATIKKKHKSMLKKITKVL